MPYSNVPESLWSKMDRCVEEVMKKGTASDKPSAVAICHSSIMKGLPEDEDMSRQDRARAKARQRSKNEIVIKDLSDLSVIITREPEEEAAPLEVSRGLPEHTLKEHAADFEARTGKKASDIMDALHAERNAGLEEKEVTLPSVALRNDGGEGPFVAEKAATVANYLESGIHRQLTVSADDLFGNGNLTRDERIAVSSAVGDALDAFNQAIQDKVPSLTARKMDEQAPSYVGMPSDSMPTGKGLTLDAPLVPTRKFTPEEQAQIAALVKEMLAEIHAKDAEDAKALITQAEVEAKAAEVVAETGKSAEELIAKVAVEQEAATKENPNRHPVSGKFITATDGKTALAHDEPFATRVMPDATNVPKRARKWPSFLTQIKARLGLVPRVQPLRVFKDAQGNQRWVMLATNNRRDRDNPPQILTDVAHKEFISYLDAHPDRAPEAWVWHTPGTAWGKADWWDYSDGFMVYSGTVYAGKEAVAENLAKLKPSDTGVSHGMLVLKYDPTAGLINQYRTFELSPLPATRAANEWTSFHAIAKEVATLFTEAKRKYLVSTIGEDQVKALEAGTAGAKEVLDAIGVEQKETSVVPPEKKKPVVEKAIPPQFLKKPAAPAAGKPPAPKAAAPAVPAQAVPAAAVAAPAAAPAVPPHAHGTDGTVAPVAAAVETPAEQAADTSPEGAQEDVGEGMQNDAEAAQTADETQQAVMALADRVNMLTDKMDAVMGMMQSQGKEIGALKATDDEKLSWLIRPRVGPQIAKEGYRASVAPETKLKDTIDDATLKTVEPSQTAQWFATEVLGSVGRQ